MHCDAYMSDTYEARGPVGLNSMVCSRTQGFGGYGTIAYDRAGRLVTVYSNARAFQLELMDPYTLEELASYDLPPRPWYFLLQGVMPWEYIGAGMYFYLDHQDRAVVPTTDNTIKVIQVPGPAGGGEFEGVREYDLSDHVVPLSWPKQDSVAWVLPDWRGEFYWFATTEGMVGTVCVDSGAVRKVRLGGKSLRTPLPWARMESSSSRITPCTASAVIETETSAQTGVPSTNGATGRSPVTLPGDPGHP